MINNDYLLFALLVVYCSASLFIFIERLIYFIRCICDSNFRKKQPKKERPQWLNEGKQKWQKQI